MLRKPILITVAACILAHASLAVIVYSHDSLPVSAVTLLGLCAVFASALWLSCAHELAHFGTARVLGASGVVLQLSSFRVSYDNSGQPWKIMLVSAAGPMVGMSYGTCGLLLSEAAAVSSQPASWITAVSVISCMQGLFMLPFAGDGLVFWNEFNSMRKQIWRSIYTR